MSNALTSILGDIAPTIASCIGGRFAGAAVAALEGALGFGPDVQKTPEELAQAIQGASPEEILKIKQAEAQFKEQLLSLQLQAQKQADDDRANAREREEKVGSRMTDILAIWVLGALSLLIVLTFAGFVPMDSRVFGLVGTLFGFIGAEARTVFSYYFGSSSENREKVS